MAWARTVAVVVPSPATSLVLLATSRTICAPMFSRVSPSSISFATVTPSLVMMGEPNFLLITTLRPRGPSVTFTASASTLTPRRIAWRESSPCTIIFAISKISYQSLGRSPRLVQNFFARDNLPVAGSGFFLLLRSFGRAAGDDSQNFVFLHDQQLFAVNLDFRSGIFAEQNAVAFFYGQGNGLAFVKLAGSRGNHNAFLRFLFCGLRDDDAAPNGLCFLDSADDHTVMQRSQLLWHNKLLLSKCLAKKYLGLT